MSEMKTAWDVIQGLPARLRKEKAAGENFSVHLKFSDEGDYTVQVKDGECLVQKGVEGEADCLVETNAKTYIDLEMGNTNPAAAFMMGKLKISDLGLMMKFIQLFDKLFKK